MQEVDYAVYPCCGLCKNGKFKDNTAPWGTCHINRYPSGRRDGTETDLKIHRFGRCAYGFDGQSAKPSMILQSFKSYMRKEDYFEDLVGCAWGFHIELIYHHDEDCPENCCWEAKSPYLPKGFEALEMGRTECLQRAVEAIKAYFKEETEKEDKAKLVSISIQAPTNATEQE